MRLYFFDKPQRHKSSDTDNLIQKALRMYCDENRLTPYCGKIYRTSKGKPVIDGNLHVSATHTDSVVIIGVDTCNFGIDCEEKRRKAEKRDAIAERFFTDGEKALLEAADDRDGTFLDIWVRKEAYVKYTGEGFSGLSVADTSVLDGFELISDENLIIYVCRHSSMQP